MYQPTTTIFTNTIISLIQQLHQLNQRLWIRIGGFIFITFVAVGCGITSPPPETTTLSQITHRANHSNLEPPLISLDIDTSTLDCHTFIKIIEFTNKFHFSQISTESFNRKLNKAEHFVHHVSSLLNPLAIYVHHHEQTQISAALSTFIQNPTRNGCDQLSVVTRLYSQGALRYFNAMRHLQPAQLSSPPKLNLEELKTPAADIKALKARIQQLINFEHYYLSLASKLSGNTSTLSHYEYINRFYTSGDFKPYINQLFADERMIATLIKSYLRTLDPYSNFYSNFEFVQSRFYPLTQLNNQHVGVGITASEPYGFLTIQNVISQSPAYKLGKLKANDTIIAIYDKLSESYVSSFSLPYLDMIRLLKGKKNSTLKMLVVSHHQDSVAQVQPDDSTPSTFKLLCEEVSLRRTPMSFHPKQVKAKVFSFSSNTSSTRHKIGYLNPTKFYRTHSPAGQLATSVSADVIQSLHKMNHHDLNALVLDLRGNPGGHFTEMLIMHHIFSNKRNPWSIHGSLNTRSLNRIMNNLQLFPNLYTGPLVILVNKATASAAENLAYSLQSIGRAIVVGSSHTLGKSLMQSMIYLNKSTPDAGAFLVSTHQLKPLNNRPVPHGGLLSDIIISTESLSTPVPDNINITRASKLPQSLTQQLLQNSQKRLNQRQHSLNTQANSFYSLFNSRLSEICKRPLQYTNLPKDQSTPDDTLTEALYIAVDYATLLPSQRESSF